MSLDSNVKRTFSINEPCDVRIQPFLLIDRTRDIVTAPSGTLDRGSDKNE